MKDDLDGLIDWLEGVSKDLGKPETFFMAHEARYLEISRRIASQVLLANRPHGEEAESWRKQIDDFVGLIFARQLLPGLEIIYAGRIGFDRQAHPGATITPISYSDVLDWVNAGPENGGKDITAIESARNRSPEQIAYDVHNAILQYRLGIGKSDFSGITQRLEEWVDSRVLKGDLGPLLDSVAEAWLIALSPIIERDLSDWIDRDVLGR